MTNLVVGLKQELFSSWGVPIELSWWGGLMFVMVMAMI